MFKIKSYLLSQGFTQSSNEYSLGELSFTIGELIEFKLFNYSRSFPPDLIRVKIIVESIRRNKDFMSLYQFFLIICLIESGDDPFAIGKSGEFGAAQIMPIMMRDFNRISNKDYPHEWAFCKEISFEVFETVLRHYEPEALNQLDFEVLAKFWNGGPGWREKNLENYWGKVLTMYLQPD